MPQTLYGAGDLIPPLPRPSENEAHLFAATGNRSTDETPTVESLLAKVDATMAEIDRSDEQLTRALMEAGFTLVQFENLGPSQLGVGPRLWEAAKRAVRAPMPLGEPIARK